MAATFHGIMTRVSQHVLECLAHTSYGDVSALCTGICIKQSLLRRTSQLIRSLAKRLSQCRSWNVCRWFVKVAGSSVLLSVVLFGQSSMELLKPLTDSVNNFTLLCNVWDVLKWPMSNELITGQR